MYVLLLGVVLMGTMSCGEDDDLPLKPSYEVYYGLDKGKTYTLDDIVGFPVGNCSMEYGETDVIDYDKFWMEHIIIPRSPGSFRFLLAIDGQRTEIVIHVVERLS